jgi:MoxR-like ATPase
LPEPFLVLATQNPVESEGVYALPEAQRDRFLLKITVDYPSPMEELTILQRMSSHRPHKPGIRTYFQGSNAGHVVRYAPCSVLVVRN